MPIRGLLLCSWGSWDAGLFRVARAEQAWLLLFPAFNRCFASRFPRPQEREDGLTEWDRFARTEYLRLAMEEDAENDSE